MYVSVPIGGCIWTVNLRDERKDETRWQFLMNRNTVHSQILPGYTYRSRRRSMRAGRKYQSLLIYVSEYDHRPMS